MLKGCRPREIAVPSPRGQRSSTSSCTAPPESPSTGVGCLLAEVSQPSLSLGLQSNAARHRACNPLSRGSVRCVELASFRPRDAAAFSHHLSPQLRSGLCPFKERDVAAEYSLFHDLDAGCLLLASSSTSPRTHIKLEHLDRPTNSLLLTLRVTVVFSMIDVSPLSLERHMFCSPPAL